MKRVGSWEGCEVLEYRSIVLWSIQMECIEFHLIYFKIILDGAPIPHTPYVTVPHTCTCTPYLYLYL